MGAGLGAIGSGKNTSYAPGYDGIDEGANAFCVDPDGNQAIRGPILTDEGGFRCNFSNSSVWVSLGGCSIANGDTVVYGQGFLADDLHAGDYFAITGQESFALPIESFDDTTLTLSAPWAGTTVSGGAGVRALTCPVATADGTVTVASGLATIASGTAINGRTGLYRSVDTLPLVGIARLTLSQRIVNQTFYLGFGDNPDPTQAKSFAWFAFDGATVTAVKGVSGRNPTSVPIAAEQQSQTLTIASTASAQEFRVELLKDRVIFVVAGAVNNTNSISVPLAADHMFMVAQWVNGASAPASSTNAVLDFIACNNANEVTTYPISREPQPVTFTGGTLAANQTVNLAQVAGTNTVTGGLAGTLGVGGFAAHSAAASGNPVQIGGVVSTALETSLVANDASRLLMTTAQQVVVKPYGSAENDWQYTAIITTNTQTALTTAAGASLRNYCTDIELMNTSATATTFTLQDGASTALWQVNLPASMTMPIIKTFATPRKGTANAALNFTLGTTGANVFVNAAGYKSF